jgi:hypothetical protein
MNYITTIINNVIKILSSQIVRELTVKAADNRKQPRIISKNLSPEKVKAFPIIISGSQRLFAFVGSYHNRRIILVQLDTFLVVDGAEVLGSEKSSSAFC